MVKYQPSRFCSSFRLGSKSGFTSASTSNFDACAPLVNTLPAAKLGSFEPSNEWKLQGATMRLL